MNSSNFVKKLVQILAPALIAGTTIVALAAPSFTFSESGDISLVAVDPAGDMSISIPSTCGNVPARSIAADAFAGCGDVTDIIVPSSVETIEPGAFDDCASLTGIWVEEGNPAFSGYDGALYDFSGEILITCPPGRSGTFTIPEGVKYVAEGAFANCRFLTTIVIPSSVTDIGAEAFVDCVSLVSLVLPPNYQFDLAPLSIPDSCAISSYKLKSRNVYSSPIATYTICFNANGGTGSMENISCTWNVARALPPVGFSRKGFKFAGWARSAGGDAEFKDRQSVKNLCDTNNGVVTLYARWIGLTYSAVFHEHAGGRTVKQTLRYGNTTALRKNPFTKSGCLFRGWSSTPDGKIKYKDGQQVSNLSSNGSQVHFYAQWAVRKYSVRFNANGGKGSMAEQNMVYGKTSILNANAFTRTGHVFTGWSLTPTGSVKYSNKQAVTSLTASGKRLTFYARWRPIRYTVVFDPNGGTGSMANQTLNYGESAKLRSMTFGRPSGVARVFTGWSKSRTGKVNYGNCATVSNLSLTDGAKVRLYAQWAIRDYKVRFNANGGSGSMADEAFAYGAAAKALSANAFSRTSHIFLGWSRSATTTKAEFSNKQTVRNLTATGGVVTLYAIWKKIGDPNIVLCLGDSITEGYRCIGLPYPSRLAALSGKTVRNYGKGGKLSSYGASIAEDALRNENPGYVCILFGANDAIHHANPSTTKENLRKIIRLCKKYNAKPIIASPTPQIGSHERFNSEVKAIARQVRALAQEENVKFIDLYTIFNDPKKYLNPADGLHLSDAGGSLMARSFYNAF